MAKQRFPIQQPPAPKLKARNNQDRSRMVEITQRSTPTHGRARSTGESGVAARPSSFATNNTTAVLNQGDRFGQSQFRGPNKPNSRNRYRRDSNTHLPGGNAWRSEYGE